MVTLVNCGVLILWCTYSARLAKKAKKAKKAIKIFAILGAMAIPEQQYRQATINLRYISHRLRFQAITMPATITGFTFF